MKLSPGLAQACPSTPPLSVCWGAVCVILDGHGRLPEPSPSTLLAPAPNLGLALALAAPWQLSVPAREGDCHVAAPFLVWKDLEAVEAGGKAGLTVCDPTLHSQEDWLAAGSCSQLLYPTP